MNLLFLLGVYPNFGGTEKITTILANQFASQGSCVCIASFEQPKMELMSELHDGVTLHKLEYPVVSGANVERLKEIIDKYDIDIIMNQWCLPFHTTVLCNEAIKGTNCKLLSVLHGVPDNSIKVLLAEKELKSARNIFSRTIKRAKLLLTHQIIKSSIRYVYKNSDRYILLSKGFIPVFQRYTNIKELSKLAAIGNPVTIPTDYSTEYLTKKRKQILYVGRMDIDNKRVDRIIDAWAEVSGEYQDWELVLVGGGPHLEELKSFATSKGIERVRFMGFVKEEPIQYYKDASVLMLTSDLEGFGLVIVEAMSYGVVPIVYGNYPSVYDIIDNSKNGFITDVPYSHQQSVDALKQLMNNPDLLSKMAEQAQAKSKYFMIERVMNEWESLFKSL